MKWRLPIKREIKFFLALMVLLVLIAFAEREQHETMVKQIGITIENFEENHFIDEQDVRKLMQFKDENLIGATYGSINLKEIEAKIKQDKFIEDAELYSDLKGNLLVKVELRRPIARIVRNDAPDAYIGEDGVIMPVSEKYTARVPLISGAFTRQLLSMKNLLQHEEGKKIMELLAFIAEDEFWEAQIAQLDMNAKGKITFYTQVGGEQVEFGYAENIENKFNKLMIYYKDILPAKGWNTYKRVNLEYENQIVAE
ncbi:MAG: cell division protein FtsQ/DivIB [Cyclobacteriaceae bacterium]|jgi:cell division protein FtsQ|nr:cell division protein FtsQ/DivIB [Flammeovirgaceae bacterium]MCZ8021420.1 cell division protein FtsQ/DivIB [Cytophagales bacterium]MCZ8327704.1 cell division protein FtsQ/DivIB [Cyclobacteriaceae bacterium]